MGQWCEINEFYLFIYFAGPVLRYVDFGEDIPSHIFYHKRNLAKPERVAYLVSKYKSRFT